jgi:acyl carrier protein
VTLQYLTSFALSPSDYLIYQVAQYLLKNYQARLLLIGKTALPEKHLWNDHLKKEDKFSLKIKNLQALENLGGEVIYQAVDVANYTQVQQAVDEVKQHWKGELDGVIHLAGIYKDCLLLEETKQSLAAILRPKVLGTWILHQLIKESQGIFISFSSLASFFGGASLGSYAAANTFLEHLNNYQKSKNLFPSYCYSWTTWKETGISKGYQMQYLTQSQGYYDMTVQQGLDSFLASLYHNQGQLMIGLDGSNSKIKRFTSLSEGLQKLTAYYVPKSPPNPINLADHLTLKDRFGTPYNCSLIPRQSLPLTDQGEIDKQQLIRELQGQENSEWIAPRTEAEGKVAQIWQNVLNLPQIGIHDNFFELGGHSLLASQVISRLRDVFPVELSLQSLLEYPTVASLTQTLEVLNVAKNSHSAMRETQEDYEEGEL